MTAFFCLRKFSRLFPAGFFDADREDEGGDGGKGRKIIGREPEERFQKVRGKRGFIEEFFDGFTGKIRFLDFF